jgi:hypothetical protein
MMNCFRSFVRRPGTARLRLQSLEDRTMPSFGFGSAFNVGNTGSDFGFGIALDGSANSYVTGYYNGTVNFDPNNTNPSSTHVLTASGTSGASFVAKYLADGTFQWATDLGPVTGACESVAVQGSNVYVGYVIGTSGGDTYVSKLDAGTGTMAWSTDVGSGAVGMPGVAAGPSGGAYVSAANAAGQAFVSSLDATGAVSWTQTSSGGSARGLPLTTDAGGNVITGGYYTGTVTFGTKTLTSGTSATDAFVWKLNAAGGTVWAGSMGGNSSARPGGITVDGGGNVIVSGWWSGSSTDNNFNPNAGAAVKLSNNGGNDVFIAKLAPGANGSLTLAWAKDVGGSGTDVNQGLATDAAGNIYTTGEFTGTVNFNPNKGKAYDLTTSNGYGAAFVSKLDSGGNFVAAAALGRGSSATITYGRGIAVDGSGNVYSTGNFISTADFDPTSGTYNLVSNGGSVDAYVSKLTPGSPQLAVGRGPDVGAVPLTQPQLAAAEAAAVREWAAAGLPAADLARMKTVTADITTLGGDHLGAAELNGTEIALDATADGWGWSVDPTAKPMAGRMDLVTVVAHELGHVVGLDSRFAGDPNDLMYAYLSPGERRLPGPADMTGGAMFSPLVRTAAEDAIDWLGRSALLKPKSNLFADWLSAGDA